MVVAAMVAALPKGIREAFEECGDLLDGLNLGFQDRDLTEFQDTFLECCAECMRDNGIEMDDPDFLELRSRWRRR